MRPVQMTPIRRAAANFVQEFGITTRVLIKVRESKSAYAHGKIPAWEILVKPEGAARFKCIGAVIAGSLLRDDEACFKW